MKDSKKNQILETSDRMFRTDPNEIPLFSYWKGVSVFWAMMRRLGYDGHRGQVWVKGVWDNMGDYMRKDFWTDIPPKKTLFVSKDVHKAIIKYMPEASYSINIIETDSNG